jgi:ribosomal protein L35AE/L33A
MFEAM